MEKDSFIIIDANSLANRAFYAMTGMTTARGEPVGAVYGFTAMLVKLIEEYRPKYIAAAFDVHAPTFRHRLSPEYKATRKGMPQELASQMELIKDLLSAMGVKIFELAGYEADDIIGTLAKSDAFTYVLTGDRDSLQLVDGNTHALLTKKGITEIIEVTPDNVAEVFGVPADRVVDYKALAGDSSDNISGVPGIGEKSAAALIAEYGSLDGVYRNVDGIPGSKGEKLRAGKDAAYLSYKLAEIDRNVPIEYTLDECLLRFPFSAAVRDAFARLDFKSLLKREELFKTDRAAPPTAAEVKTVALKRGDAAAVISALDGKDVAILFAADGLHVAASPDSDLFAPVTNDLFGEFTLDACVELVKPLLSRHVVTFDLKSLLHALAPIGIPDADDVSLMGYLLEYRLRPTTAAELLSYYAECTEELEKRGMTELYRGMELPLCRVLFDMERDGFMIDRPRLADIDAHFTELEKKSAARIVEIYGSEFNLNSPKQLAKVDRKSVV